MATPIPQPVVIDFETHPILPRPEYPPIPVGVALQIPGHPPKYLAFDHPAGNNSTVEAVQSELRAVWDHPDGLLFHNGKFDIDVAETHMGMPRLPWHHYHDTLFLLFLSDPHAPSFALKPSAERLLGRAPEEATELHDWLVHHRIVQKGVKGWGAFIAQAPGDLVGRYAVGDVERTGALFQFLMPEIIDRGMVEPYDRERELMLILLENERRGIPVDLQRLSEDVERFTRAQTELEAWILLTLGMPDLNLDAGRELLDALRRANKIDLDLLDLTPTGKHKFDKENLSRAVLDPTLKAVLGYRASLKTCLATFMTPWLRQAEATGGRIHTSWSQTRNFEKGKAAGAVTGRLSSSPNFQNIPGGFPDFFPQGTPPPFALPVLPRVRRYIVPEEGHILIDRDYSQQELRILAEYAGGALFGAYASKPDLDLHELVRAQLSEMLGYRLERKPVKTVVFGLIYGMGVSRMAESGGVDIATARAIKEGVLALFPGIREINQAMRAKAERRQPLRTWGGREYHCESPVYKDGEMRTFEYKMINVLIQGSAADCTKQAILNYYRTPHRGHLLVTVHDELLISVTKSEVTHEMNLLKLAMAGVGFDVPMISDGKSGTNWCDMNKS
ncbi:MAG: hypothetical protein HY823_14965 [Acidobacteria bacterium]|nr:hypothetical protein [Acidobacteriota bacterium]